MATSVQTKFDVGGVLLDQPFKIRRLGHFGFNASKLEESLAFYTDLLGFRISDKNRLGYFLRHGTDHHAFALFDRGAMQANAGAHGRDDITINQITWQTQSLS